MKLRAKPELKVPTEEELDDQIEGKRTYDVQEKLSIDNYCYSHVKILEAEDLTYGKIQKNGFIKPMLVERNHTKMGLVVPNNSIQLEEIMGLVGSRRQLEVMNAETQATRQMSMKEWCEYYATPRANRKQVLNVISLEFSGTPFDPCVQAPRVVQELDWVERAWPLHFRYVDGAQDVTALTYPKVIKYCLMSVADCYTDFHIDLGGTSVWYHILRGKKIFWLIPPNEKNLRAYEDWALSGEQERIFLADKCTECQRIVLEAGNTFFIPTGWIHAVYTPEDSLVFGGNFLHSFNIGMQLRIAAMEQTLKVPSKYRYPFFDEMQWYVYNQYNIALTGVSFMHKDGKIWPEKKLIKVAPKLTSFELQGLRHLREWLFNQPESSQPEDLSSRSSLLSSMMMALALQAKLTQENTKSTVTGCSLLTWPVKTEAAYRHQWHKICMRSKTETLRKFQKKPSDICEECKQKGCSQCSKMNIQSGFRVTQLSCDECGGKGCEKCKSSTQVIKYGGDGKAKQRCIQQIRKRSISTTAQSVAGAHSTSETFTASQKRKRRKRTEVAGNEEAVTSQQQVADIRNSLDLTAEEYGLPGALQLLKDARSKRLSIQGVLTIYIDNGGVVRVANTANKRDVNKAEFRGKKSKEPLTKSKLFALAKQDQIIASLKKRKTADSVHCKCPTSNNSVVGKNTHAHEPTDSTSNTEDTASSIRHLLKSKEPKIDSLGFKKLTLQAMEHASLHNYSETYGPHSFIQKEALAHIVKSKALSNGKHAMVESKQSKPTFISVLSATIIDEQETVLTKTASSAKERRLGLQMKRKENRNNIDKIRPTVKITRCSRKAKVKTHCTAADDILKISCQATESEVKTCLRSDGRASKMCTDVSLTQSCTESKETSETISTASDSTVCSTPEKGHTTSADIANEVGNAPDSANNGCTAAKDAMLERCAATLKPASTKSCELKNQSVSKTNSEELRKHSVGADPDANILSMQHNVKELPSLDLSILNHDTGTLLSNASSNVIIVDASQVKKVELGKTHQVQTALQEADHSLPGKLFHLSGLFYSYTSQGNFVIGKYSKDPISMTPPMECNYYIVGKSTLSPLTTVFPVTCQQAFDYKAVTVCPSKATQCASNASGVVELPPSTHNITQANRYVHENQRVLLSKEFQQQKLSVSNAKDSQLLKISQPQQEIMSALCTEGTLVPVILQPLQQTAMVSSTINTQLLSVSIFPQPAVVCNANDALVSSPTQPQQQTSGVSGAKGAQLHSTSHQSTSGIFCAKDTPQQPVLVSNANDAQLTSLNLVSSFTQPQQQIDCVSEAKSVQLHSTSQQTTSNISCAKGAQMLPTNQSQLQTANVFETKFVQLPSTSQLQHLITTLSNARNQQTCSFVERRSNAEVKPKPKSGSKDVLKVKRIQPRILLKTPNISTDHDYCFKSILPKKRKKWRLVKVRNKKQRELQVQGVGQRKPKARNVLIPAENSTDQVANRLSVDMPAIKTICVDPYGSVSLNSGSLKSKSSLSKEAFMLMNLQNQGSEFEPASCNQNVINKSNMGTNILKTKDSRSESKPVSLYSKARRVTALIQTSENRCKAKKTGEQLFGAPKQAKSHILHTVKSSHSIFSTTKPTHVRKNQLEVERSTCKPETIWSLTPPISKFMRKLTGIKVPPAKCASRKRRTRACGECVACKTENCDACVHCKDRLSGKKVLKQRCVVRKCLARVSTKSKKTVSANDEAFSTVKAGMNMEHSKKDDVANVIYSNAKMPCQKSGDMNTSKQVPLLPGATPIARENQHKSERVSDNCIQKLLDKKKKFTGELKEQRSTPLTIIASIPEEISSGPGISPVVGTSASVSPVVETSAGAGVSFVVATLAGAGLSPVVETSAGAEMPSVVIGFLVEKLSPRAEISVEVESLPGAEVLSGAKMLPETEVSHEAEMSPEPEVLPVVKISPLVDVSSRLDLAPKCKISTALLEKGCMNKQKRKRKTTFEHDDNSEQDYGAIALTHMESTLEPVDFWPVGIPKNIDLLTLIFSHLPKVDIVKCMLVCKSWRKAARNPVLWPKAVICEQSINKETAWSISGVQPRLLEMQCTVIDVPALQILLHRIHSLQCLRLDGVLSVCSMDLSILPPSLEELHLINIPNLRDSVITSMFQKKINSEVVPGKSKKGRRCLKIRILNLSGTAITDAAVKHITRYLPSLSALSLRNCSHITNASIDYLSYTSPSLLYLDMSGCDIDGTCLNQFLKNTPGLSQVLKFDVEGSKNISTKDVKKFVKSACKAGVKWRSSGKSLYRGF